MLQKQHMIERCVSSHNHFILLKIDEYEVEIDSTAYKC